MAKRWNAKLVSRKVAEAIGLEEDLIIQEIETAESKAQAISRMESIQRDAAAALRILQGRR